ncbi:MAG: EAL domain-containing protein [Thioalkalispiraceae bacterium]|jgi:diguanylate cyclase (GGDEF)-like protein
MVKLVRNFTLTSLVSMIVVVVILGAIYRYFSVNQMLQNAQQQSMSFVQLLDIVLKKEESFDLSPMSGMTAKQLRRALDFKLLDKVIREYASDLELVQVNVYTPNGKTLYSTDRRLLGTDRSSLPGFHALQQKQVISDLVSHDHFYTLDGITRERDVVSSYIPVSWAGNIEKDTVVQVYVDVTRRLLLLEQSQYKFYFYTVLTLSAVFFLLFAIIKRTDKELRSSADEIERQKQQIDWHAYCDQLTGLPNRALFKDRLDHAMQWVRQHDALLALLYLDLDRFKNINDTFGYAAGDELLVKVAKRLKQCISNHNTVARLSGGEFALILEDVTSIDDASEVANRIIDGMTEPLLVGDQEIFLTLSIGIIIYPFADETLDDLVHKADTAMYQAKEAGRNTYRFYSPKKMAQSVTHFTKENALRHAIERNEFELYYQPIVKLETGKILGVEALLRWCSASQGILPPAEFISVLEDTGLIIPVGQWVLETACHQGVKWQKLGFADFKINVNISAKQFKHADIVGQVSKALDISGLPPHLLNLEITESILIKNRDEAIRILDELNSKGVSMSIDDFGTGYSSMAYLKNMPIETIKIDKSFVRGIPHDMDDVGIIYAINMLSENLRLNVIAEGVETHEQREFLKTLNVCGIQGYLVSRPVPATKLEELLQNSQQIPATEALQPG